MTTPTPYPPTLVDSDAPVTLIGGAPVALDDLAACLARAPRLVAADGGAGRALELGHWPEAVIGDMDSLGTSARTALSDVLHPVSEQDSTDFEKCLTRISAPMVLAVGFSGARQDHALAAFNAMTRHPDRRVVLVGTDEATVLAPPEMRLELAPGTPVSLFPLAPVQGTSEGLEWPIDAVDFAPDGAIGTSNRSTGPVRLRMSAPKMLLFVPRAVLRRLLDGLADAPRWNP